MAKPLRPFVRGGGYYPSKKWIPLVRNGGYTTQNGGETEPVWATASGAIASFTTPFAYPLKKLLAQINPVQDLHGYDAPYPAGAKNLIDASTLDLPKTITSQTVVATYSTSEQTKWTVSAIVTNNSSVVGRINIVFKNVSVTVGNTYTEIPVGATNALVSATLDASSYTFTDIRLEINGGIAGYSITVSDVQINKGDPLDKIYPYSNICPISGWTGLQGQRTGANLFDKSTGIQLTNNNVLVARNTGYGVPFKFKKNVTYTISCNSATRPDGIYIIKPYTPTNIALITGSYSITFAPTEDIETGINFYWENGRPSDATDIMIEVGSVAHDYEPYTGEAISVSFPSTVYGGSDEVISGNGTSTMGMVDLGDLNWTKENGLKRFYAALPDAKTTASSIAFNGISSMYKAIPFDNVADMEDGIMALSSGGNLSVRNLGLMDKTASEFKTAMSGVQLCYELATPQTFSHTGQQVDTLVGQNNIWVTSGDVEVTYRIE